MSYDDETHMQMLVQISFYWFSLISQIDIEKQYNSATNLASKEDSKSFTSKGRRKAALTTTEFDAKEQAEDLQRWTSRHPISESRDASSVSYA